MEYLRAARIEDPKAIIRAAQTRRNRPLTSSLMLIAADHPARGALGARGDAMAMADRGELLHRLVTALNRPGVDGVLGTADILEDLLLLGALENKIVIGSMNRGGLLGASYELEDAFTGYDAAGLAAMRFDGGKTLTRISLEDRGALRTMEWTAQAINELADHGLMALVEPFMSEMVQGKVRNDLTTDAVIRSISIASGLGKTSRGTWLKIPVVPDMNRVMASTTLPTLLLGGDPTGPQDDTYDSWRAALQVPGVCGLIVGRALLFPEDDDVAGAVDTAAAMVHGTVMA